MEEFEEREMHKAICSDCGAECEVPFKPEEGKAVRCQDCFRKNRPQRNNFGGNNSRPRRFDRFDSRPREMHKATCSECKKECEVPFKPTAGKDVFCQDCFKKRKSY
jgi:CxxC-x17-CxxC domain-containing protein